MSARTYELTIDGPLLREQRQMLAAREADLCDTDKLSANVGELATVRGLIELTDAIADQAYDQYGIDCLLVPANSGTVKAFRVAAISANANSFGLVGHVLVAADGAAYEVGRSLSARPRWQQGDTLRVCCDPAGNLNWAALGVELPHALSPAPAGVVREIWRQSA